MQGKLHANCRTLFTSECKLMGQPIQDEGTARALYLAQYVNTPVYIVHVMSKGAAGEIAAAKLRGQRVIGETIASGIAAEEKRIWDPDFKVNIIPSTVPYHTQLLVRAYRLLQ